MQVFDREDDRRINGQPAQETQETFVQLAASPLRMHLRGGVTGPVSRQKSQFGGYAQQRIINAADLLDARSCRVGIRQERSDGLDDRAERQGALGQAHAAALKHDRASGPGVFDSGRQDSGLADARLPADEHGSALSGAR